MGYTRETQIKDIKERINIVDIISGYVNLKKSGDNFIGLCPFHNEKTPSFTVNEKKGVFHCFGCGAGGDVISFLMRVRNEGFNDTVKYLANVAGITLATKESDKKKDDYYSINELIANYYHHLLFADSAGKKAFKYLTVERGLSTQTINDYTIGYAPNRWDAALSFLKSHDVPVTTAFTLGIIIKKQNGNDYYDRFRGRIMFPIKDYMGRIIAFGGRMFDGEEPKYLNSPDSDVYKKGMSLYGINTAKSQVTKAGYFIFVEGYMDVLLMHQYGFKNTVATTGTAVSIYHINTVSRYARDAVFLFDGDAAGEKAAMRTLEVIIDSDIEGRYAMLPTGYDPDTFLVKYGRDAMNGIINNAQPLFESFVKRLLKDSDASIANKLRAINNILLLIQKMRSSPIKQELYIKRLSELTGISESSIRSSFGKMETSVYEKTSATPQSARSDTSRAEVILLSIVIDHPEKVHILFKDGIINTLANPEINASIRYIKTLYDSGVKNIKSTVFSQEIEERTKAVISEAMLNDLSGEDIDALYEQAVNKIKKTYYVNEQKKLSREIVQTKAAGNKDTADELLKKKKEIAVFHKQ